MLMDIRDLEYLATPPEVSAFASPDFLPPVFAGRRVAIVCRRGAQFGVARAFAEPDLAMAWLGGGQIRPFAGLPDKK